MSGHSKWANIKHKKEKSDAQKGKIFTKLAKEIIIAAREGGGDPESNSRLRDAIEKAKENNMPNDNITRAVKRGSGELDGEALEEVTYEGYGPSGVAVIVEAMTDNRNRTAAEMRHIFDRSGGSLGASGCVAWMFDKKGLIVIDGNGVNEDELMMVALDAGAEDIINNGDDFEVYTSPEDFSEVKSKIKDAGYTIIDAEVRMIPQNTVKLDIDASQKVLALIDRLDEHDDVQNVYHNLEIPEELLDEEEE
ncbi:MAG: YebC/PmpR family DNA-binding transcriptional regulator [Thermoanaerobacteraceae bacterium]|nr:YebC/PmpR family DNA-binding transcriptional regulator [Thermoanaerobacteraceae bacterium]